MATVRDTLDNFGVEVVEEIFQNGTPHDQRRKVACVCYVIVR